MTGATVRILAVLATASLFTTACAGADEGGGQPSEAKPRADVEAAIRTEVQALADLARGTVTNWQVKTSRCDIANPGRSWALSGTARIPLSPDSQVATVGAIRDRWHRDGWQFGESRVAPDVSLPDTVTGSLLAGHPSAHFNVSVTSRSAQDHLAVGFGSGCYQPARGEDPANG
ncbi:hypothetical protein [Phytohabitans kaempferiae]|uniref:Lipoprotein n=1 Tax=Phytohabitans kaempferiae TaxID=1620943 RepID=A0ABV6LXV5_9ACTN